MHLITLLKYLYFVFTSFAKKYFVFVFKDFIVYRFYLNKILPFIVFSILPEEPHGETACWKLLIFNFIW